MQVIILNLYTAIQMKSRDQNNTFKNLTTRNTQVKAVISSTRQFFGR